MESSGEKNAHLCEEESKVDCQEEDGMSWEHGEGLRWPPGKHNTGEGSPPLANRIH